MPQINWLAALVAAVSSFMLGGLWYSNLLFLNAWTKGNGPQSQDIPKPHPARVFGISFVFSLVAAVGFAVWLGPAPVLRDAVLNGLLVGVCFVGASFGINYQFSNRSPILWLVDAGYHVAQFLIFGVILGLWH